MVFESRKLFPVRLFGFSMFWAWLFLVAVSPSPAFGQLYGLSGAPFEIPELLFRVLALGIVFALRAPLASVIGKRTLLAISIVAGTGAVALLAASSYPLATTVASALAALAEVSMFLMWLCFFGYMRLDETLKLIVLSYAGGSIICLATSALPSEAAIAIAALLPIASGLSFLLSERHYQAQRGSELFVDIPSTQKALPRMPHSVWLMTIALALVSSAFAWLSAVALFAPEQVISGPLVQSGCSLVATLLVLTICEIKSLKTRLYGLYRGIPLLMGGGFCLLLVSWPGLPLLGSCAIVFSFLLFEALSLNDYCNVVKTDDSSLLATMVIARLAASLGMLVGWMGAEAVCSFGNMSTTMVATVIIGSDRTQRRNARFHRQEHRRPESHFLWTCHARESRGDASSRADRGRLCRTAWSFKTRDRGARLPLGRTHHPIHFRKALYLRFDCPKPCAQDLPED